MALQVVQTVATISEDGTLVASTGTTGTVGKKRVVIVIDDDPLRATGRRLPDLSEFRTRYGGRPFLGSSVVELRNDRR